MKREFFLFLVFQFILLGLGLNLRVSALEFELNNPLNIPIIQKSNEIEKNVKFYKPSQYRLSFEEDKSAMYLTYHLNEINVKKELLVCHYAETSKSIIDRINHERISGLSEGIRQILNHLDWKDATLERVNFYHESAGTDVSFSFPDLKPNTYYSYLCAVGDIFTFKTGDFKLEHPEKSSKLLWVGDMGTEEFSEDVYKRIKEETSAETIDNIVLVGDISYADAYNCSEYELAWNRYFTSMEVMVSKIPFMVIPGNHEHAARFSPCMSWATDFVPYNSKFRMPQATNKFHNMWFSFNWRHVHIVGISTETDYPKAPYNSTFGDQLKWLEEDLKHAQLQRNKVPWIVVMGHRPIYSSHIEYSHDGKPVNSSKNVQDAFEELLYKYNVDMYICGHVHSYERTHPVYKSEINSKGPVHIVNGHAGNPEGRTDESSYANPLPSWSAFHYTKEYGYAIMDVSKTELTWTMYGAVSNKPADKLVLKK